MRPPCDRSWDDGKWWLAADTRGTRVRGVGSRPSNTRLIHRPVCPFCPSIGFITTVTYGQLWHDQPSLPICVRPTWLASKTLDAARSLALALVLNAGPDSSRPRLACLHAVAHRSLRHFVQRCGQGFLCTLCNPRLHLRGQVTAGMSVPICNVLAFAPVRAAFEAAATTAFLFPCRDSPQAALLTAASGWCCPPLTARPAVRYAASAMCQSCQLATTKAPLTQPAHPHITRRARLGCLPY